MKFCEKCGAQLDDDARFCISCGSDLNEGGSNNTAQDPGNGHGGTSNQYINDQNLGYLLEAKDSLLGMIIKPISTIENAVKSSGFQSALILSCILALANGILSTWLTQRIGSLIFGLAGSAFGGSDLYGSYDLGIHIPYIRIFIFSIILTFLCIAAIFAISFAISKLVVKGNKGFIPFLNIAACSQVPYIISLLVGIILSYASLNLLVLMLVLGAALVIISTFEGIRKSMELSENSAAFTTCVVYGVLAVVIYSYYVNIFLKAIG